MVKEPDEQPQIFANAGPDMRLYVSEEAFFDGSASSGKGLRFCWDFDEADATQNDAFGETASHVYRRPGGYVARLTVLDESQNISSDSCFVEVLTPPSRGVALVDRFPKGYMGQVHQCGNKFTCHLTESAAWYGRLDNCGGKEITLKIFGFGKRVPPPPSVTTARNDRTFSKNFKAVCSPSLLEDGWRVLEEAIYRYDAATESMEITFKPDEDPLYVAWSMIYTHHQLRRYLGRIYLTDGVNVETIGASVEDRPIYLVTIKSPGQPGEEGIDGEKPAVWVVAQQHGYEMAGGPICEGMMDFLLSDNRLAERAVHELVWKIVPMVNPDAMSHPCFRYNTRGIDLNRNWDTLDNGSGHDAEEPEPEVRAVKDAVEEWLGRGGKIAAGFDIHAKPATVAGIQLLLLPGTDDETQFSRSIAGQFAPGKFPHAVVKADNSQDPGTFCNWLVSRGNGSCALTLEVALGGYGPRSKPRKYAAVPENLRALGEFLAEAIYRTHRDRQV
jgi:hypothetical protein